MVAKVSWILRRDSSFPAAIYLARLAMNVLALAAAESLLVPVFAVLCEVPLLAHPWALLLVGLLGNVGIAAVGTLVSAMTAGLRRRGNLLVLLVLPLVAPVLLGAAEAIRLSCEGRFGPDWWRWVQLLGSFAVIFVTAGTVLFEFVVEE
jgi:heme exporter protein B